MTKKTVTKSASAEAPPVSTRASIPWPLFAALLPCLGSLYFCSVQTPLPSLDVTRPKQSLRFASYMYHHGDEPVKAGATLNTEFRFRNIGTTPVTINEVGRSCGCMTPEWTKTVAPGEIGSLQVPLDMTRQTPGFHEYSLVVKYADPAPQETWLTIKAIFPEKMVIVQPRALFLSQGSDRPIPWQVAVSDYREDPLRVKDVMATAIFVSAEIKRKTVSDIVQVAHSVGADDEPLTGTRAEITGTVTGNVPPGRHHVLIAATTDDDEFPVITIPMMVNGPSYPPGEEAVLNRSSVRLHASDEPDAAREASVILTAPTSWKISHALTWPEELKVRYEPVAGLIGGKQATRVNIKLDELPQSPVKNGVVQLFANDGKDLVTVNVTLVWPETSESR